MQQKTISEYLDNEYADYGMHTIENRAIPSVVDGFKPTQRKIIFIANKVWKNTKDKPLKVFQFGGRVAADAMYHSGDASLNGTIIGMAQSFKNSIQLLDDIGQFGKLRSPEAGAARYISTKLNDNFRLLYKDFDLTTPKFEEGYEIEPLYFLPIIPTVLLNGGSGVAVGFATNILNRHPIELIDACLKYTEAKPFNAPTPFWHTFKGMVEQSQENKKSFSIKGIYKVKDTTTIIISELPVSMTFAKYEAHLSNLQDKGIIQLYDDNSNKDGISYTIKMQRAVLADLIKKNKVESTFKLIENETENLTCLDENGKLIIFESVEDIIKYFVNFRITFYDKRKSLLLHHINENYILLSNKAKFIKLIIDKKLVINNIAKDIIIENLTILKFDKIDDSFDYLLQMPIYNLTKEKYEDLLKQINNNRTELEEIKKLIPLEMYKNDLIILKKALKHT